MFGKPLAPCKIPNSRWRTQGRARYRTVFCRPGGACINAGTLSAEDAAAAKLKLPSCSNVSLMRTATHGGAGFMDEYPISRQSADAKIATIYAGALRS
ncbi:MAG: hypothetical protein CM15mP84_06320 [Cellvibrionales bacterium]|nr:MAG: hypothetical protein CM15mP84_06320 [Cellvibrionales bacterium]